MEITPLTLDHFSYLGEIRYVPFWPNASDELGHGVADAAAAGSDVVVLERHGSVCLGADVADGLPAHAQPRGGRPGLDRRRDRGWRLAGFPVDRAAVHR